MQCWFTRSSMSPTHVSCFELPISAWMMTAALLSTAVGCGIISDAPHQSLSRSAVLQAGSVSGNPPADQRQTDIPSSESSSAAIILHSPETQEASPAPTLPSVSPSTILGTGLASWYGAK